MFDGLRMAHAQLQADSAAPAQRTCLISFPARHHRHTARTLGGCLGWRRCVGRRLMIVSVRVCVRRRGAACRGVVGGRRAGLRSAEGARTIVPARALHAFGCGPLRLR
eukprot:6327202-Prymnesium_polylepis.1